ncbi:hypothetical protein PEDI_48030 [Persicobacter diffluens]|uniref:3-keto-alpha-glucoside-1,2-lyase/3-keto-2-hydroxy-glucal hydratase domain-containing protein n=1 Tax=Persicobacter diffluens TaxID=981 RepID=A0AAN4W225_9BACT|nr:hypothetical protein PEDI_48030 [Persicobacter diffluens]
MVSTLVVAKDQKKKLFNGKNLKGWETLEGGASFKVENGEIVGVSKAGRQSTFLATKKSYTNFILEYEYLLGEGLNSGVQIRSQVNEKGVVYGMQVEAEDSDRAWSAGIYDQSRRGWRYPLEYHPEAKSAVRKGQWNKVKVVAYENRIVSWLNGVNVANLLEEDTESGIIALQVHGCGKNKEGMENRWRNITIVELDQAPDFSGVKAPMVSYLKNELTAEEQQEGWELLWDGKTTNGWRGAKRDDFPEKGWKIEDGVLTVLSSGGAESAHGGDIVTTRPFKNFILELDFKFTEGANSGIKYFVDTELNKGKGSAIGCEFQILDDKQHPDAKKGVNGNRTVGSLYDLITADSRLFVNGLKPQKYVHPSQWNRARIEVRGNKVRHVLNGCTVVEYERNTQMWKALVAYSKYKKWPGFGEAEEGLILLQDHGDEVHFKNIKIKPLEIAL